MAVDRRSSGTYSGNVYACWTEFNTSDQGRIMFSKSTNQGVSYSTPLAVTSFGTAHGCSLAVGPTGNIYVAWFDYGTNQINTSSSTNGGTSFGSTSTVGSAAPPSTTQDCYGQTREVLNGNVRDATFSNLAADPLNSTYVYAAWNHYTSSSSEVHFSRSTNSGSTWSTPVRVNDSVSKDQFRPRIATTIWYASEPDATIVKLIWYDRRNDASNLNYDVYSDGSSNLGASFTTDARWTDTTSTLQQLDPIQSCTFLDCYFGDYIGLFSLNPGGENVAAAWGDTRLTASGSAGTCPDSTSYPSSMPDNDIRTAIGC